MCIPFHFHLNFDRLINDNKLFYNNGKLLKRSVSPPRVLLYDHRDVSPGNRFFA